MTDIVDSKTRSRMMAGIRSKDTKPEMALRRSLHALGYRYRLHAKDMPGKPDLVLPKYRAVIFVHGCFWHRHQGCPYASTPSTRLEFWAMKFAANISRDDSVCSLLRRDGWRVATMWECSLRRENDRDVATSLLIEWLRSNDPEVIIERQTTGNIDKHSTEAKATRIDGN